MAIADFNQTFGNEGGYSDPGTNKDSGTRFIKRNASSPPKIPVNAALESQKLRGDAAYTKS